MTKFKIKKKEKKQVVIKQPGKYVVELIGEQAKVEILGAFIAKGSERLSVDVVTIHKARNTEADTFLRAVVKDKARVEIRGLIKIEKEAQKTNAFLKENVLLLSGTASAEAVPDLEIEANDVKASHAASVGKIDEEQVFYLMSRGLSRAKTEELIVEGFLNAVRNRIVES
jgi:Fe-S cluster assembly protein SufD